MILRCPYIWKPLRKQPVVQANVRSFNAEDQLEGKLWISGDKIPFPVQRQIVIEDIDPLGNCTDARLCPVNFFWNNLILMFELAMGHEEEWFGQIPSSRNHSGVCRCAAHKQSRTPESTNSIQWSLYESTGGRVYKFISRPLTFEYHIERGRCCLCR